MGTQLIVVICSLVAFALLGFFFYWEIKKLDSKKTSKKKGRTKYMPQVKNPR